MVTQELSFPIIWENGSQAGYGGNQEWFLRSFQRKAGCASVTGANLAAYYSSQFSVCASLYEGQTDCFSKEEFISGMEAVYRYMTPGPAGFPVAQRFANRFLRFAADRGVNFQAHTMFSRNSWEERLAFVKTSIAQKNPVALLILRHRAPEMKENTWHWVTITGWEQDANGEKVIFSNYGVREQYNAQMLFENHPQNVIKMVRFSQPLP